MTQVTSKSGSLPLRSVYIETSVVSRLLDVSDPDRQQASEELFKLLRVQYAPFVSYVVVDELERTSDEKAKQEMLRRIQGIPELQQSAEAGDLVRGILKMLPSTPLPDAQHVALATANRIHTLVTWNVRHLLKKSRRDIIAVVSRQSGYVPVEIKAPNELL